MKIDQSICNDWTLSPLKNCFKACGLKIKIASEQSVSLALCGGVSCIYTSSLCLDLDVLLLREWAQACSFLCVSHAHAVFVVHGHSIVCIQELSPCQVSGIYKSRQWKTDHQDSSCRSSILPRASKDSLQHALLIPTLLQTKISAAFYWFFLVCWGCSSAGSLGVVMSAELHESSGEQLLFKFMLWMTLSPVCSAFISCGVLTVTWSWFHLSVFAYLSTSLSVWSCLRVFGGVWFREKILFTEISASVGVSAQWEKHNKTTLICETCICSKKKKKIWYLLLEIGSSKWDTICLN